MSDDSSTNNNQVIKWVMIGVLVVIIFLVLWWVFCGQGNCSTVVGCASTQCCYRTLNNGNCLSGSGFSGNSSCCPPATCNDPCSCKPADCSPCPPTNCSTGCGSYYCKYRTSSSNCFSSSSSNDCCPPVSCYTPCCCA